MMRTMTRRGALVGVAVLPLAAVPVAADVPDPDAELMALWSELTATIRIMDRAHAALEDGGVLIGRECPMPEQVAQAFGRRNPVHDYSEEFIDAMLTDAALDPARLELRQALRMWEAERTAAGIRRGLPALRQLVQESSRRIGELVPLLASTPAHTGPGLAVKVRLIAWRLDFADPHGDAAFDDPYVDEVVAAVYPGLLAQLEGLATGTIVARTRP